MPDLWYFGKNGERHGPIPLRELKELAVSGNFGATDPVWSPGMADWMAASEVEGLLPTPASPPVSTPEAAATPAVALAAQKSTVAEERWHYEYQGERRETVSFEELKHLAASGQIQLESLVWKRGMAEWTPARQIDGLFSAQSEPTTESADLWYYGDGEHRHGPVSLDELKALASCGQIQPDHMVWNRGMAEWTMAAEVQGLFPVQAKSPVVQPSREPLLKLPPTPTFKEDLQRKWDAAAPHLSRAATATQANLERSRKFIHRQHLGTRLRLLISRLVDGVVWCYNAARPHVLRAWSKRPSKQEVARLVGDKSPPSLGRMEADGTPENPICPTDVGETGRGTLRAFSFPEGNREFFRPDLGPDAGTRSTVRHCPARAVVVPQAQATGRPAAQA